MLHIKQNLFQQNAGDSQSNRTHLHAVLEPMRLTLRDQEFLGGQETSFADFAAAGAFAVC